jgi:hypothetical protein
LRWVAGLRRCHWDESFDADEAAVGGPSDGRRRQREGRHAVAHRRIEIAAFDELIEEVESDRLEVDFDVDNTTGG